MKIEMLAPEELKPYKLNAKRHSIEQIEGIGESMKRFGVTQPVVIDEKNEIILGHGRVEAAKNIKLEKIPCVRRKDLSEKEVRALRLIDNRIAETGWDPELLALEFEDLDFNFDEFNISFKEFALVTGDKVEDPEKEWLDMPEYKNEFPAFRSVMVHIQSEVAFLEFQDKMGQSIGEKTKFIYYPFKPRDVLKDKGWTATDEDELIEDNPL